MVESVSNSDAKGSVVSGTVGSGEIGEPEFASLVEGGKKPVDSVWANSSELPKTSTGSAKEPTFIAGIGDWLDGLFNGGITTPARPTKNKPVRSLEPGLVHSANQPGLFYQPGDTSPKAEELDGAYYGLASVLDDGATPRRYFALPALQDNEGNTRLKPVGGVVKKGEPVYRLKNTTLDQEIANADIELAGAESSLPSVLSSAKNRTPVMMQKSVALTRNCSNPRGKSERWMRRLAALKGRIPTNWFSRCQWNSL